MFSVPTSAEFIPKYCAMISLTVTAALEPACPFSNITTTAICGSSYGANPINHAFVLPFIPVCADPVFPPTSTFKPLNIEYAVPQFHPILRHFRMRSQWIQRIDSVVCNHDLRLMVPLCVQWE